MLVKLALSVLFVLYLAGCSSTTSRLSISTTTGTGASEQIPATLLKPDGSGPFPAIVIMHDCSGLGPRSSGAPQRWATELLMQGYVVLMPDSFTTRGHAHGVCTDPFPSRVEVNPFRRIRDAYAALFYLTHPVIRRQSQGGNYWADRTADPQLSPRWCRRKAIESRWRQDKRAGFAAAVALYPNCAIRLGSWRTERQSGADGPILSYTGVYKPIAPLLILIGENDDWTPAEPCRKLTDAAAQAGYPVAVKIYPGAHHSFDSNKPVRYVAAH